MPPHRVGLHVEMSGLSPFRRVEICLATISSQQLYLVTVLPFHLTREHRSGGLMGCDTFVYIFMTLEQAAFSRSLKPLFSFGIHLDIWTSPTSSARTCVLATNDISDSSSDHLLAGPATLCTHIQQAGTLSTRGVYRDRVASPPSYTSQICGGLSSPSWLKQP